MLIFLFRCAKPTCVFRLSKSPSLSDRRDVSMLRRMQRSDCCTPSWYAFLMLNSFSSDVISTQIAARSLVICLVMIIHSLEQIQWHLQSIRHYATESKKERRLKKGVLFWHCAGTEMAQLVCGGCHTLLMYIRGATSVQCSCCHTVNLALEGEEI